MIFTSELKYTLLSALVIALLALVYGVRLAVKGPVHFERIDRQGGSMLLRKGTMELGYWILQPVARLFVLLGVTPNQVSWASLALGSAAGVCLAFGHFGFAAILATISGFFDSLDGMVARLSGRASESGEILDSVVDRYVEFFFLSGLVIYYRQFAVLLALTLFALLGSFMVSYSTAKAEALQVEPPKGGMRRPERAVYLILGATLSAITVPWFEPYGYPHAEIGYPMIVALALVGLLANISSVERFCAVVKAVRARENVIAPAKTSADDAAATAADQDPPIGRSADVQF